MKSNVFPAMSIVKVATLGDGVQEVAFEGETLPLADALEQADMDLDGVSAVRVDQPDGTKTEYEPGEIDDVTVKDGDKVFLKPAVRGGTN